MSAEGMNLGAVNRRGEIPLVKTIWRFEGFASLSPGYVTVQ